MPSFLPELLCPAGDEAALRAAVDNGADAVYLGYTAFGARASAVNFDGEALESAVRYAHLYHARVYVTVNTLVKPAEMPAVREALLAIAKAGADAVIVQDLGVARLVREAFPTLSLHASTQMAICNASGAEAARGFGFSRVVLARECSLQDIRRVAETGVETEVFAHGALCTAVSGRCLMSSMSGGRSGNRGRCAQPCRQCFQLAGQSGPLLSQRDLCLLDDLPALCEAGVASLKLEGRLKSAEYVSVVASVYRRALDGVANGSFQPGDAARRDRLLQIYNRGGFTRGHAMGDEDAALITPSRVSHEGLPIGEIISVRGNLATLRLTRSLNDGDSLQLRGRTDIDLRYSGHDVPAGGTATLRLRPGIHAEAGMSVSRLSDARQLEAARAHQAKPIPVAMEARFAIGEPMRLSMSDGDTSVTVEGAAVEPAKSRATTVEDVRKQLEKLGNTPFALRDDADALDIALEDGAFLSVGALNALRRSAAERLAKARIAAFGDRRPHEPHPFASALPCVSIASGAAPHIGSDTLVVIFSELELADKLRDAGATMLVFSPRSFLPDALASSLDALPDQTWLRLPPQMTQSTLEAVLAVLRAHGAHLGGIMAESAGQLGLALPLPVLAGEGVPVTNREAMQTVLASGACGFSLWPEWTCAEQRGLLPLALPALLKVYGRETLMLLNHCPERVRRGLSHDRADCALCTREDMACGQASPAMTDRKGYRFPIARTRFPEGCELSVLGALATDLRGFDSDRRALGAGMLLHFTNETPAEQLSLTRGFASLLREGTPFPSDTQTTSGHWMRGVE